MCVCLEEDCDVCVKIGHWWLFVGDVRSLCILRLCFSTYVLNVGYVENVCMVYVTQG